MKFYDYYKTYNDFQSGNIFASFSELHETERRHFESLGICRCCKVTTW